MQPEVVEKQERETTLPESVTGPAEPLDAVLVSHAHWDREWYRPFQHFRYRLVALVDRILDTLSADPDFAYFTLDGQTIVLEDYLALRPERELELKRHVRSGRLLIGPWYVLPDEFLVGGEAMVRNLLLGREVCSRFGNGMRVGYVPDTFGHIGQLPQILAQCDVDSAVLLRGLADEPTELWWEAPDGTRLLTIYLRNGYDNAAWLPDDPAGFAHALQRQIRDLAQHGATHCVLLMNGTDHIGLTLARLPALIRSANEQLAGVRIRQGTLAEYIAAVRHDLGLVLLLQSSRASGAPLPSLPIVRGELRSPKRHHLLAGVLSTRMAIKQRNEACETALTCYAEPLAAIARLVGGRDLGAELRQAWRFLVENHAHDSICGCSIDAVHEEMQVRFDWSAQIADAAIDEGMAALASRIKSPANGAGEPVSNVLLSLQPNRLPRVVTVFNPCGGPRADAATFRTPAPPPGFRYRLVEKDGSLTPLALEGGNTRFLVDEEFDEARLLSLIDQIETGWPFSRALCDAHVQLKPSREAMAAKAGDEAELDLTLVEQSQPDMTALARFVDGLRALFEQGRITRWHVRAWVADDVRGSFMAQDVPGYGYRTYRLELMEGAVRPVGRKARRAVHAIENEFFRIEASPTDGTLALVDKRSGTCFSRLNRLADGGDRGDEYSYCPPAHDPTVDRPAAPPRIAVRDEGPLGLHLSVTCHYRLPERLAAPRDRRSARPVRIPVTSDIRLRPGVARVDIETTIDNRAQDHRLRVLFPTPFRTEHALAEGQFDVVDRPHVHGEDTTGWVEQPVATAPQRGWVAVTEGERGLLLANRGLPEYELIPGEQGATIALTLLRCVGWLSREDLDTRAGNAGPQLATPGAQCRGTHTFAYALVPFSGALSAAIAEAHAFRAPLRAIAAEAGDGRLPPELSFVHLEPAEFDISALKPAQNGHGLIVRFWNTSAEARQARLTFGFEVAQVGRVNLLEERPERVEVRRGRTVELSVRGKEIVTLRVYPAGRGDAASGD